MSDNLQPGLGTFMSVSATLPATYDETGYEALTPSKIGEITDVPSYGPQHDVVSHVPLETGITAKFHGAKNNGSITVPMALDKADAGQVILKAGLASKARHAFKVTFPDGSSEYFSAKIFSFRTGASIGNVVMAEVMLEIETDIVEVDAP